MNKLFVPNVNKDIICIKILKFVVIVVKDFI